MGSRGNCSQCTTYPSYKPRSSNLWAVERSFKFMNFKNFTVLPLFASAASLSGLCSRRFSPPFIFLSHGFFFRLPSSPELFLVQQRIKLRAGASIYLGKSSNFRSDEHQLSSSTDGRTADRTTDLMEVPVLQPPAALLAPEKTLCHGEFSDLINF